MTASPDRAAVPTRRLVVLTALVAVQLWAALSSIGTGVGREAGRPPAAEAAAVCAVLAIFGLRSVPVRWIVRGLALVGAILLARFGELGVLGGIGGSWRALVWLAATAASLVLAPSSRSVPGGDGAMVIAAADVPGAARSGPSAVSSRARGAAPPAASPGGSGTPSGGSRGSGASGRSGGSRGGAGTLGVPGVVVGAAVSFMVAVALLVGPVAAEAFPIAARSGELFDLAGDREDNALVARDRLDMTTRPRLGEAVVMNVRSPVASFWRTETFDEWDGSSWSRSDTARENGATTDGVAAEILTDGQVRPAPADLAAELGEPSTQEFRIEAGYATAVPAAPSPVRVDSDQVIAQRPDGTLIAPADPLGRGTTYTVQSRQTDASPDRLRSVQGPLPAVVRETYLRPPVVTDRVRRLAEEATRDAPTTYDKVRALEELMDETTEYSQDAPLSPEGVDVVDHFLFESRLGWCEQIASSLVVMARSVGIPARLATGFAPGEWDPVGERFVVRERDAHAWAEVWFPEVGWVTFDPTADVPLAGTPEATAGATAVDWRTAGGAALLVLAVGLVAGGPLRAWFTRRRRDRSEREERRRQLDRWDVAAELEIERRGREVGLQRAPGATLRTFAGRVAEATGDPGVEESAERIDEHRYARR